jgi:ADP-ribosyl-[dinitrogen reductase] hydrolase
MNIYHTLMAGWVADAVGARLEFLNQRFNSNQVDEAMRHEGKASTNIKRGQYTDDTEMEICLMNGLIESTDEYPCEIIAKNYIEWLSSGPYDIGLKNAIQGAKDHIDMITNAKQQKSESNGLMMRCVPIAIIGYRNNYERMLDLIETEAQLSHPSPVVHQATAVYCLIIGKILHCKRLGTKLNRLNLLNDVMKRVTEPKVIEWLQEALSRNEITTYDCLQNEGHIKHAFIMAIYLFKHIDDYTYEKAIREVLMNGFTNAKIVGSMFGAYYGDCIPDYMLQPVLNSDSIRPYRIEYALERLKLFHKRVV